MKAKIYRFISLMFYDLASYFWSKYIKQIKPTKALHIQMWGRAIRKKGRTPDVKEL